MGRRLPEGVESASVSLTARGFRDGISGQPKPSDFDRTAPSSFIGDPAFAPFDFRRRSRGENLPSFESLDETALPWKAGAWCAHHLRPCAKCQLSDQKGRLTSC